MATLRPAGWPYLVRDAAGGGDVPDNPEIAALRRLRDAGLAVADVAVVPARVEERFYRLNNLPERLLEVFAGVDPADPDEDDLEELAPDAQALLERHFLLDELIDAFYERIADLPSRLHVRRPGRAGRRATRGRPALLAMKLLWADDWSFDALAARVPRDATFALEARDVLVHGEDEPAPPELAGRVTEILGAPVIVHATAAGQIARLDAPALFAGSRSGGA